MGALDRAWSPLAHDGTARSLVHALNPACRRELPWLSERCAPSGALDLVWSPLAHDGSARALVHALKLRGLTAAADLMAAQIAAGAPGGLLDAGVLVPVPGNPRKRRARGFDPAERIATALARRTGLRVQAVLRADRGAAAQVGAGRRQRLRRGGIGVAGAAPEQVTLVDDVRTTGATLDACARALKHAGTATVVAVTYTRTLG
ncbi:MAG: ComF family protein [Actinobacteria bacterium]|nr:MAG: ComF family protein [Actinomycetota bacterium]